MTKEEKTKQAFEMIEQGVKDVYSSDNFRKYLSCCSKFHSYSLNNTLLILAQKPDATLVAGYNAWQRNFNRHVDKGERGLIILAPVTSKITQLMDKADEDGNPILDENGDPIKEERVINQLRFTTTTVFDISQTSGEPLPSLIHNLTGSSDEILAFIDSVKNICTIPIDYHSPSKDAVLAGGAKGYYSIAEDRIVLNMELEDMQIAKTLIHEYSHSILHKKTDKDSDQREIEAESLAFVLCDHFGIDTSDYSFGYIASYAAQDEAKLKTILSNIQSTAHEMIDKLEPLFAQNLKKRTMVHEYITPVEMDKMANDIVINVVNELKANYNPGLDDSLVYQNIESSIYSYFDRNKEAMKIQEHLYNNHTDFKRDLKQAIYKALNNPSYNPETGHPFIDDSIERRNYEQFEAIAAPLLSGDACYIKYGTPHFMDLNVEIIDDNRYAMSHNYVLNGDLMADPDVEFTVDKDNRLLYPESYQQDNLQFYQRVDKDPVAAHQLNEFMDEWLNNIQENQYKVKAVYTEEQVIENANDIRKFCKENNLANMAPKVKEKER
ncbi:ArdC family protein [Holdemanella porci]|uniref:ArdC family protein n=1 Tax=Holdemanella porci TaxID=2652276 RepID=UPI0022E8B5A2|nr:ArdC family protein [Holdemanella porci]